MQCMDEVRTINLLVTIYCRASLFCRARSTAGEAYWLRLVRMKDSGYRSQLRRELYPHVFLLYELHRLESCLGSCRRYKSAATRMGNAEREFTSAYSMAQRLGYFHCRWAIRVQILPDKELTSLSSTRWVETGVPVDCPDVLIILYFGIKNIFNTLKH